VAACCQGQARTISDGQDEKIPILLCSRVYSLNIRKYALAAKQTFFYLHRDTCGCFEKWNANFNISPPISVGAGPPLHKEVRKLINVTFRSQRGARMRQKGHLLEKLSASLCVDGCI